MARYFFYICCFVILSSCSSNILEFSGDEASKDALVYEMQELVNDMDYNGALSLYNSMSASLQAKREIRNLYASAYLGLCGLEFVSFVNDVQNGTGNLFNILLETVVDASPTQVNHCVIAESVVDANIDNFTPVVGDYNMALLNGLVKIGAVTNLTAATATNTLEPTFDPCSAADISDVEVSQLVTATTRVLSYMDDSSLSFFGNFNSVCQTGEPMEVAGLCEPIDSADVTASHICAMRSLLKEGAVLGFDIGCPPAPNNDISNCNCLPGCPF